VSISNQKQTVKIQSTQNSGSDVLDKSRSVINKRLKDYGLQHFDVSIDTNQKIIEITFSDKVDMNTIMPLLTSRGRIEFYETYNRPDVIKLLEKGDKLFSILNIPVGNGEVHISPDILGCCKPDNIPQVDSYLTSHYVSKPGEGIKFLWSKRPNKEGDYYLHLLKHDAALDRSQISGASENKTKEGIELTITFNESGILVLQTLSRNNLNKPIAIVIDDLVYFDPVMKDEITGGKCSITGNFTSSEIALLKSLINNNELPSEFESIK
jgi:hypothetical protein